MDTIAGERERKSLLPLLLNPVTRREGGLGKWLAISFFGISGLAINLAATVAVSAMAGLHPGVPWAALTVVVPLSFLASALELLDLDALPRREGSPHTVRVSPRSHSEPRCTSPNSFCVPWIYIHNRPGRPVLAWLFGGSLALDFVWLFTAVFFAALLWYRRRTRAELQYWLDLARNSGP